MRLWKSGRYSGDDSTVMQAVRRFFNYRQNGENSMYIIAGLGNPGSKYAGTRHNAGFETVERLAEKYRIDLITKKFQALCGTGVIEGQKVLLLKPQTYMNLSGESIRAACDFYKIDVTEELIVLYDDISLAPGQLRIRKKGSAGGHNGIKSIIARCGTSEFARIKVGVGGKPEGWDLADHVLGHFSKSERELVEQSIPDACLAAGYMVNGGADRAMNEFNAKRRE